MKIIVPVLVLLALAMSGCQSIDGARTAEFLQGIAGSRPLDQQTIVNGLKEALRVGTDRTVASTSVEGGYAQDPTIRIALPESLDKVAQTLRTVGYGPQVDQLERKMNAAAEEAAAQAAPIFAQAVTEMSFADARDILKGSDTAATDYFRDHTRDELKKRYQPIVQAKLSEVGAVKTYQDMMGRYNKIPLVPKPQFTLTDYVTDEALDGLFQVLALEEQKIRQDPAARSTALLKRVFGSN